MKFKDKIVVDPEDQWLLDEYSWSKREGHGTEYAKAYIPGTYPNRTQMSLHQAIMGCPLHGLVVDHKDGNGSNCTRDNMRVVTKSVNAFNSGVRRDSSTGYRGVHYYKSRAKYMSRITINKVTKFLGYFDTAEEAAEAREVYSATQPNG